MIHVTQLLRALWIAATAVRAATTSSGTSGEWSTCTYPPFTFTTAMPVYHGGLLYFFDGSNVYAGRPNCDAPVRVVAAPAHVTWLCLDKSCQWFAITAAGTLVLLEQNGGRLFTLELATPTTTVGAAWTETTVVSDPASGAAPLLAGSATEVFVVGAGPLRRCALGSSVVCESYAHTPAELQVDLSGASVTSCAGSSTVSLYSYSDANVLTAIVPSDPAASNWGFDSVPSIFSRSPWFARISDAYTYGAAVGVSSDQNGYLFASCETAASSLANTKTELNSPAPPASDTWQAVAASPDTLFLLSANLALATRSLVVPPKVHPATQHTWHRLTAHVVTSSSVIAALGASALCTDFIDGNHGRRSIAAPGSDVTWSIPKRLAGHDGAAVCTAAPACSADPTGSPPCPQGALLAVGDCLAAGCCHVAGTCAQASLHEPQWPWTSAATVDLAAVTATASLPATGTSTATRPHSYTAPHTTTPPRVATATPRVTVSRTLSGTSRPTATAERTQTRQRSRTLPHTRTAGITATQQQSTTVSLSQTLLPLRTPTPRLTLTKSLTEVPSNSRTSSIRTGTHSPSVSPPRSPTPTVPLVSTRTAMVTTTRTRTQRSTASRRPTATDTQQVPPPQTRTRTQSHPASTTATRSVSDTVSSGGSQTETIVAPGTPTRTATFLPASPSPSPHRGSSSPPHHKNKTYEVIGLSFGALLLLIAGMLTAFVVWRRRRRALDTPPRDPVDESLLTQRQETDVDVRPDAAHPVNDDGASSEASNMLDEEPTYDIGRVIGRGGYGAVYEATRSDGAKVAVKYVPMATVEDEDATMEEVRAIMRLHGHPHIIEILAMSFNGLEVSDKPVDPRRAERIRKRKLKQTKGAMVFDEEQCALIVTRLYTRGDVRRYVNSFAIRGRPFPVKDAVRFSRQLVSAVKYAHSRNVVHRDLKPENMLIAEDGNMVLTDFGLSKVVERTDQTLHTRAGSLPYVAPECFQGQYSKRVDNWSIGCVMYAMAAQRVDADNTRHMFQEARRSGFEEMVREDLQDYPEDYIAIIFELLRMRPTERLTLDAAEERLEALEAKHKR